MRQRNRPQSEVLTSPAKGTVLTAITVFVWIAAVGSAAALTYNLNRPLVYPNDGAPPPPISSPAVLALESAAITMPTPEIHVATAAGRRAAVPSPVAREPRDIAAMHCSEWHELQAGSGHVQICD
jgi:hypothetical protein